MKRERILFGDTGSGNKQTAKLAGRTTAPCLKVEAGKKNKTKIGWNQEHLAN